MIRKYIKKQPLSVVLIAAIWVLCLIPIPETPLDDISMVDKWTHLVMYGTLTVVVMAEYGRRSAAIRWQRFIVCGMLLPVVMGGLVELTQAYCTGGTRSGDWLDFAANSLGVCLGAVIGIPLALFLATRHKDAST